MSGPQQHHPQITGTQINYYFHCHRQLWLFSHFIHMEQESDTVFMGKMVHEHSYERENREIDLGPVKLDFFDLSDGVLVEKQDFDAEKDEREHVQKRVVPVEDIDALYCMGEITLNTRLINFLSQRHIAAHFFNYYGFYTGSFIPRDYLVSGKVLVGQVKSYMAGKKRLQLACETIDAAIDNILHNLRYYANRGKALAGIIRDIETGHGQVDSVTDVNRLMTLEGRVRESYYRAWDTIIEGDFKFEQRTRRPPQNMLNALISFGNSMLYTTVLGEVYHTQLNPAVSYLHEPSSRRYSLCLDIAEVFKPFIVDRLIFKLLNQKSLQKKHFEAKLKFCYLNEAGRKIFVKAFDERMKTTVKHRKLGRYVSYKRLIRLECYKLVKAVMDIKKYKAFRLWW